MKKLLLLLAISFSFGFQLHAQTRTVYGHVIAEDDLGPIPGANIQTINKLSIGQTDANGRFKINVPQNQQTLLISFIGYDEAFIHLNTGCDTIEIVMMNAGTYDFMSSTKVDKERLKMFNKLPELHSQAYKKGIFTKETICYTRAFEPEKPPLDSIQKEDSKMEKQIKSTFKRLAIGDTIKIPFSGQYKADGTDRTTLSVYSIFASKRNYDCIVKFVVTGKNRHKRHYNLVCKVVNCDLCNTHPTVFNGRDMKIGEVLTYNMRYFKILEE